MKRAMLPKIDRVTGTGPEDFGLDEIVGYRVNVHMERMGHESFWIQVSTDQETVTVNLTAKKNTLYAKVSRDE